MRRAALLSLSAVALIVLTGCTAPAPEPKPTGSTSASATPTPTPTAEPIVAPTPAFDVTCDDVAAGMAAVLGDPAGPIAEVLPLWSSPGWYPGPAQYMFARTGGIACSTGDREKNWDVEVVPGAQSITDGAASRDGYSGEQARCELGGYCTFEIIEGDVLIVAGVIDPSLTSEDASRIEEALRRLGAEAQRTVHEIELVDSDIVGVPCTRFLTAEEMSARVGMDVVLTERFGGWGIPAEVYHVVNGSSICHYNSGSEYEGTAHLTITTLPAGAWAFEQIAGATAVEIDGADAALSSVDPSGRPVLDLRVGSDWIRLTTYEGGALDAGAVAAEVVKNFTVGRPAPQ